MNDLGTGYLEWGLSSHNEDFSVVYGGSLAFDFVKLILCWALRTF